MSPNFLSNISIPHPNKMSVSPTVHCSENASKFRETGSPTVQTDNRLQVRSPQSSLTARRSYDRGRISQIRVRLPFPVSFALQTKNTEIPGTTVPRTRQEAVQRSEYLLHTPSDRSRPSMLSSHPHCSGTERL